MIVRKIPTVCRKTVEDALDNVKNMADPEYFRILTRNFSDIVLGMAMSRQARKASGGEPREYLLLMASTHLCYGMLEDEARPNELPLLDTECRDRVLESLELNGEPTHANGQILTLGFVCPALTFTAGDAIQGDITIAYTLSGSSLSHSKSGKVGLEAEP